MPDWAELAENIDRAEQEILKLYRRIKAGLRDGDVEFVNAVIESVCDDKQPEWFHYAYANWLMMAQDTGDSDTQHFLLEQTFDLDYGPFIQNLRKVQQKQGSRRLPVLYFEPDLTLAEILDISL